MSDRPGTRGGQDDEARKLQRHLHNARKAEAETVAKALKAAQRKARDQAKKEAAAEALLAAAPGIPHVAFPAAAPLAHPPALPPIAVADQAILLSPQNQNPLPPLSTVLPPRPPSTSGVRLDLLIKGAKKNAAGRRKLAEHLRLATGEKTKATRSLRKAVASLQRLRFLYRKRRNEGGKAARRIMALQETVETLSKVGDF